MNPRVLFLFTVFLFCTMLSAQRRNGKSVPAKVAAKAVTAETIQDYITRYEFDKALQALSENRPETKEELLFRKAELGASMLQGIRRVDFLDSIVIDKSRFLEAIHLSDGSGRLTMSDSLLSYTNDFDDVRIICRPDSLNYSVLTREHRVGSEWHTVAEVPGVHTYEQQNYPYLMPDGQTLYFAKCGDESLGGYDIFVTRYDADSKRFLRTENIGMPFNSPANDYMFIIDEHTRLGWFVTDRRQPEGKVCVFIFRPSDTYDTYPYKEDNLEQAIATARIPAFTPDRSYLASLSETQHKQQLFIVINDATVYTDFSQFHSPAARRIADEWLARKKEFDEATQTLDSMRSCYRSHPEMRTVISEQESAVRQLETSVRTLEKDMRKAEIENLQ